MRYYSWVLLSFVVAAILVVIVMQSAVTSAFTRIGYPDYRILFGWASTSGTIAVISGVATLVVLVRNERVLRFTDEVIGELARVTWPTRDETVRASVVVIFTTIFTASLLAAFDYLWKNLADYFLFSGSVGTL